MQNTQFKNIEYWLRNSSPETLYSELYYGIYGFFIPHIQAHTDGQYFVFDIFSVECDQLRFNSSKKAKKMSIRPTTSPPTPHIFYHEIRLDFRGIDGVTV